MNTFLQVYQSLRWVGWGLALACVGVLEGILPANAALWSFACLLLVALAAGRTAVVAATADWEDERGASIARVGKTALLIPAAVLAVWAYSSGMTFLE